MSDQIMESGCTQRAYNPCCDDSVSRRFRGQHLSLEGAQYDLRQGSSAACRTTPVFGAGPRTE